MSTDDSLPDDVRTLKAMLFSKCAVRHAAEALARMLLIEKIMIRKLRYARVGWRVHFFEAAPFGAVAESTKEMAICSKTIKDRKLWSPS